MGGRDAKPTHRVVVIKLNVEICVRGDAVRETSDRESRLLDARDYLARLRACLCVKPCLYIAGAIADAAA